VQLLESAVLPCKLPAPLKLGIRPVLIALPPHLPLAGKRCPVGFRQGVLVPEVLIPDERRVRLPAEHLQRQLEAPVRLCHVPVHILEFPRRKRVGGGASARFFRKGLAHTEAVKLHALHAHRDRDGMRPCGKLYVFCKGNPEGSPPVRPPQAAFREMLPAPVNGNVYPIFIPEGETKAHSNIINPCRRYRKTVSGGAIIPHRHHALRNGHNAGIAVRVPAAPVNKDIFKFCPLLLAVGGKVMPAVVCAGKQRVIMGNRIPPLHVVVHMRERPRHLVVVVPIGHDGDERLRRLIIREIVAALHPELRRIVGVGSPPVGHAHVLWRIVYPPVPPVGRHPQKHLIRIHDLYGVIIDALQPGTWGNRPRRAARPRHAVAHDGGRVAVIVQVAVDAPVLAAHGTVNAVHPRQADVHQFCGVIILHSVVNIAEHGGRLRRRGVIVPFLQIDVHTVTPRVFLHDPHKLRKELILRPVRVFPQRLEDAVRAVIRHGQQPFYMRPLPDIRPHGGAFRNGNAALVDFPGRPDLERKQPDLADAVAVVPERLVHPRVAHERPYHDLLSLECVH